MRLFQARATIIACPPLCPHVAAEPVPCRNQVELSATPHSDGTQHLKNASTKLAAAGKDDAKAHRRLALYFISGIEPEDL